MQIEHKEGQVLLQLKGIEILESSLNLMGVTNLTPLEFQFNVNLENRIEASKKLIFVIVSVDVLGEGQQNSLGALKVSCIYEIQNFEEVVKTNSEGIMDLPPFLVDLINSVSISTTRGVMYSTYKGTFLHDAILPIVDPKNFFVRQPKQELQQ